MGIAETIDEAIASGIGIARIGGIGPAITPTRARTVIGVGGIAVRAIEEGVGHTEIGTHGGIGTGLPPTT